MIVFTCDVKIVDSVRLCQLARIRHIGWYLHHFLSVAQGVYIHIADLVKYLQHTASHNSAHMAGMTVSTGNIVKVVDKVVQVTTLGVDIYVVHIALCTVEENALCIGNCLFQGAAHKTGLVGADLAAAHHIRMITEVHQNERVLVPVKP